MAKVQDPVCGMEFDSSQAGAQSTYHGKAYNFCSEECKRIFDEDPDYYAQMAGNRNEDSPQPAPR